MSATAERTSGASTASRSLVGTIAGRLGESSTALRIGYGSLLLVAPRPLVRLASGRRRSAPVEVLFARVLGLRQLGEAVAIASTHREPAVVALGAGVDAVHAATAAALAVRKPEHRRAAVVNAGVATLLAVAGTARVRGGSRGAARR